MVCVCGGGGGVDCVDCLCDQMVSTCLWALISGDDLFPGSGIPEHRDDSSMRVMVHFSGLATFLPIAFYSQLLHTGVPVLTQSARDRSKPLYKIFGTAYTVTMSMYTVASFIIVLYFGVATRSSCNVNWSKFTGGYEHGKVCRTWAQLWTLSGLSSEPCTCV